MCELTDLLIEMIDYYLGLR